MSQVSLFSVKLAGTIMLGFGIGMAILAFWIVERQFTHHQAIQFGAAVAVAVLFILATFCSMVGYRLLFNRPNRYGSTLPPWGWKILAGLFGSLGLAFVWMAFARSEYSALVVAFLAGMMGYWCVLAARGASTPPISSTVFPPETSLIAVGGFSPPGFEWGIEILNDDRTPMLFVVSILQDTMGMTEKNAVRVMLDIHQKGGVLLPTSTPEEANRIADLIVSEARAKDHPLVCRAVSATQRNSSGQ